MVLKNIGVIFDFPGYEQKPGLLERKVFVKIIYTTTGLSFYLQK